MTVSIPQFQSVKFPAPFDIVGGRRHLYEASKGPVRVCPPTNPPALICEKGRVAPIYESRRRSQWVTVMLFVTQSYS